MLVRRAWRLIARKWRRSERRTKPPVYSASTWIHWKLKISPRQELPPCWTLAKLLQVNNSKYFLVIDEEPPRFHQRQWIVLITFRKCISSFMENFHKVLGPPSLRCFLSTSLFALAGKSVQYCEGISLALYEIGFLLAENNLSICSTNWLIWS